MQSENSGNFVCSQCNEKKKHHAKGMCINCYKKHAWNQKKVRCKNCGQLRVHKAFGLCRTCHVKLHHPHRVRFNYFKKKHQLSFPEYLKITHKCALCDFKSFIGISTFKTKKSPVLVGLCPNHQRLLSSGNEEVTAKLSKLFC